MSDPGPGTIPAVCEQADALTAQGYPTEALALIDGLRYGQPTPLPNTGAGQIPAPDALTASCAEARNRALKQIGLAQQLATFVEPGGELDVAWAGLREAPTGDVAKATDDLTAAQARVEPALALASQCVPTDSKSYVNLASAVGGSQDPGKEASARAAVVAAARACDADATVPTGDEPKTWSQSIAAEWETVLESRILPWQDVVLAWLVIVAVLLVVARLGSQLVPGQRPGSRNWRWKPEWIRAVRRVAIVGLLLAAALGVGTSIRSTPLSVWVAVGIGLVSMVALAWASAWELRVRVTVRGEAGAEQEAQAGQIIGLLGEMGGAPPQGLLTPRGTDVTALEDAGLDAAPTQMLAKIAWTVARLVQPRTPWQARVDIVSADVHSVHVTRNGRPVLTAQVDRTVLHLEKTNDGITPDLYQMSAAVVLCALHRCYRFDALPTDVDWRAVGYHSLATTQLHEDTSTAIKLLAKAVQLDPHYPAPVLALWSTKFRKATEEPQLKAYKQFLDSICGSGELSAVTRPRDRYYVLALRAELARAVATINLIYAAQEDPAIPLTEPSVERSLMRFKDLTDRPEEDRDGPDAGLVRRMRQVHAALEPLSSGVAPNADKRPSADLTPWAHYSWACTYASFAQRAGNDYERGKKSGKSTSREDEIHEKTRHKNVVASLHRLRAACIDAEYRKWQAEDPQLKWLRVQPEYKEAKDLDVSPSPADQFTERTKPFGLEAKFKELGIRDAQTLRATAGGPLGRHRLAGKLGTLPEVVDALVEAVKTA